MKAHIIPEAFFRAMDVKQPATPVMIASNPDTFPKRAPIGVYDTDIVCDECERRFGPWDNYAVELLINNLDTAFRPLRSGDEALAFQLDNYDYEPLKLFFISLLWRAAISSQPFFNRVTLGPHEVRAREAVLNGYAGDPHFFSVVLARWVTAPEREALTTAMMGPFAERYDGINVFRFYLGRVIAYIKVDQRPYQDPFNNLMLVPDRPLLLLAREFDGSKDFAVLRKVVQMNAGKSKLFRLPS